MLLPILCELFEETRPMNNDGVRLVKFYEGGIGFGNWTSARISEAARLLLVMKWSILHSPSRNACLCHRNAS